MKGFIDTEMKLLFYSENLKLDAQLLDKGKMPIQSNMTFLFS